MALFALLPDAAPTIYRRLSLVSEQVQRLAERRLDRAHQA
jgi:hypothetical protein